MHAVLDRYLGFSKIFKEECFRYLNTGIALKYNRGETWTDIR